MLNESSNQKNTFAKHNANLFRKDLIKNMINKFMKKAALSTMICAAAVSVSGPSLAAGLNVAYINGKTVDETSNLLDGYLFDQVENLFIVSGEDYADALTGGVHMGENNGSLFFVNDKKIDERGYKRITQAENVYVIGGDARIPDSLVKDLDNFRGRIAGANRYETAQLVANIVGKDRNILITSGENFPDALSASALAVQKDYNIILTGKNQVPASTKSYLERNKDRLVYFIGGEAAISDNVKKEILSIMGKNPNDYNKVTIAGKNRYETSKAVAEAFGPFNNAIIADGSQYQDALLGTSLAAKKQAPMILATSPRQAEDLTNYLSTKGLSDVYGISTGDKFSVQYLDTIVTKLSGSEEVQIKDTVGKVINVEKPAAPAPAPAPAEPAPAPQTSFTGWVKSSAAVRSGADPSYKQVGTLSQGTKVYGAVINNYVRIEFNGSTRYVAVSDLSKTEVKVEKSSTQDALVKGAYGYLGARYVWGSANPNVGFDCSGLMYHLYQTHAGIKLNRNSAAMASNGVQVSRNNLKPGDLMFFATGGGSRISHVGMYVGDGKLIHASSPSTGVKMDNINSSYYVNTFVTARRILN